MAAKVELQPKITRRLPTKGEIQRLPLPIQNALKNSEIRWPGKIMTYSTNITTVYMPINPDENSLDHSSGS